MHYFLNKRVVQMAVIRMSAVGISLWLQIWLVAEFGAAAYGDYIYFVTLCSLVAIVSKGGLDTVVLKVAAIAWHNNASTSAFASLRASYLWKGFLFTSVSCLSLWVLHSFAAWRFLKIPTVSWGLIYATSVGVVIFQILIAFARGVERPAMADAFDAILRNGLMALVALALVTTNFVSAESAIVSYAISFYLASLLLFLLTRAGAHSVNNVERMRQEYGVKAHFGFMLSGLLSYVFFQMDTLILGAHVSAVELGAYNMACNLVRAVIFIPMILLVLVQPRIAVAFEKSDMRSVTRIAVAGIGVSFVAASLCSALLWLLGEFVLVWIDPVFLIAKDAMLILAIAHVVNSILMIVGGVISMTGRYLDVVKAQLIGGLAALVLYVVLIPGHGQVGAAVSMFAGLLIVMASYICMYRRHLPRIYGFLLPKAK